MNNVTLFYTGILIGSTLNTFHRKLHYFVKIENDVHNMLKYSQKIRIALYSTYYKNYTISNIHNLNYLHAGLIIIRIDILLRYDTHILNN